ncbi:MAG: hypothetical protein ABL977_07650 [Candidatus Eisenbacteria bacterium]
MRSHLRACIALLVTFAATAHAAAPTAPGVNLRWDQCYADGGAQYKNFACDVNTGTDRMVGSFELASPILGVTGMEIYLHVGAASATLPAWWSVSGPGGIVGCRNAVTLSLLPPAGAALCSDWAGGQGAGGLAQIQLNTQGPNHERFLGGSAVPAPVDLNAGQEYYAFTLNVTHTKTTGAGSCAGCLEPVVVFLSAIRIVPGTNPSIDLNQGANFSGSRWVSWQNGYPMNIRQGCSLTGGGLFCLNPTTFFDVVPYSVTPTRNSTWGQVKSLYR